MTPLALALALAVPFLSACASGVVVPVPQPEPSGAAAYTCAALHGQLPDEVLGQTTTATKPLSSFTSAWGDPPIILRCGVGVPAALTPTSELLTVNGVDWLPEQLERGYLFTTVGRVLTIEVTVPAAYGPESGALVDLAGAITSTVSVAPSGSPSP